MWTPDVDQILCLKNGPDAVPVWPRKSDDRNVQNRPRHTPKENLMATFAKAPETHDMSWSVSARLVGASRIAWGPEVSWHVNSYRKHACQAIKEMHAHDTNLRTGQMNCFSFSNDYVGRKNLWRPLRCADLTDSMNVQISCRQACACPVMYIGSEKSKKHRGRQPDPRIWQAHACAPHAKTRED